MPGIAIIIPRSGGTGPVIPDWTPEELGADLLAWYDPRQAADGTTVSALASTGGGPTLAQVTGEPVFDQDGLNGTPSIRFDGASAIKGSMTLSGPLTIMANMTITGSATQTAIDGHSAGVLAITRSLYSDQFTLRRGGTQTVIVSPSDSLPHSHIGVFSGSSSHYYLDGVDHAGEIGVLDSTALTIGAGGGLASFLTGHVGDVLIVGRALTPSEAASANAWLMARRLAS